MFLTEEELKQLEKARKWRITNYPYEFVITWRGEGGTVTDEEGKEIGRWLEEDIGKEGNGWFQASDSIGYSSVICITRKEDAMAFRLAWGHLVDKVTTHENS